MSLLNQMKDMLSNDPAEKARQYQKAAMQQAQQIYANAQTPAGTISISGSAAVPRPDSLVIEPVRNGYIVKVVRPGGFEPFPSYVASDIEELQKVIALALVNQKMDEVK